MFIMLMGRIYEKLAVKLTDWGKDISVRLNNQNILFQKCTEPSLTMMII